MTALQLTIVAILFQHYQPLLTPVLQHLPDGVVVHVMYVCTFFSPFSEYDT